MFDFHMHSRVSFDSTADPADMVRAAELKGLREICFTDHYDYYEDPNTEHDLFSLEAYDEAYRGLTSDSVKILRGVEFGFAPWNTEELSALCRMRDFDFVIGSIHYAAGYDPYAKEYWDVYGTEEGFLRYLEHSLRCVRLHSGYHVLGHLNYACKSVYNPSKRPLRYEDYRDLCDEIMKTIAEKGIGIEINTSGICRVGEPLPSIAFVRRFKELGGEIVTVGSDAHDASRVGDSIDCALEIAREVFGYVCTFSEGKAIYHRL